MKAVQLNCSCCELVHVERRQVGRACFAVYELNGVQYVGYESIASAYGLSKWQVRNRIHERNCLQATVEESRKRGRNKHMRSASTGKLASDFCRIMARSFA